MLLTYERRGGGGGGGCFRAGWVFELEVLGGGGGGLNLLGGGDGCSSFLLVVSKFNFSYSFLKSKDSLESLLNFFWVMIL